MPAVEFVVSAGRGASWRARYERGEVPGRWPYGLEWLSTNGAEVTLRELDPPARGQRIMSRALGRLSRSGAVGLAWDENLAHAMVTSRRYGEMHCGVIWASDRWRGLPARQQIGLRRTLARMASVWTLSRGQLDHLDGLVPSETPRHFVPFGVDEAFFAAAPYPERPMILSVGGDRDRDAETVLEAFKEVLRARPGTEAVLQTQAEITDRGDVTVIPHLSHLALRDLYRRASVVSVATRPNLHVSGMTVSLESQATARPVVLTRTPGAGDYVADGHTGFLTEVGNAAALADRIVALLDDPDAAARMGRRGRAAVETAFTSRHLAERLRAAVGLT